MKYSKAKSHLRALKSQKKRLEKKDKIDAKSESELRELLQTDRFYNVIDSFSEKGDFRKVAEAYQTTSDLYNIAASKSENNEFRERAKELAPLFEEKVPIEKASAELRLDLAPLLHKTNEYTPGIEFKPKMETVSKLGRMYYHLKTAEPAEEIVKITPTYAESDAIEYVLKEVVGPSKGKVLKKLLFQIFRERNLPAKTDYILPMQIGPNIATFKPDIAILDKSNNLKAIVETVSTLSQKKG